MGEGWGPQAGHFAADLYRPGAQAPGAGGGARGGAVVPIVATQTAVAKAGQKLTARFGPAAPGGAGWLVRRITVQLLTGEARAYVYAGEVAPENRRSGTRTGSFDECEYVRDLYVQPGAPLCVQWETTTGVALATIEYQEA
jgi:hypothetical protein